jgi:hypothetical protein
MTFKPYSCIAFSIVILSCLVLGCGGPKPTLVPVTGKVTKDGQPVTAGSIYLHAASAGAYEKDSPSSLLQVDGSFAIKTFPFGDGGTSWRLQSDLFTRTSLPT